MDQVSEFRKGLLRALGYAMLSIFLLPTITLLFVRHAESSLDAIYTEQISYAIEKNAQLSNALKQSYQQLITDYPPSSVCESNNPALVDYRNQVCAQYSELWQYHMAEKVARWSIGVGAAVLIAIFALGGLAFANRRTQYISFVLGWNMLRIVSACSVIVQGTLMIWLSFWLTAFFFQRYFVKLIVIAAVLAGGAVLAAVAGIFKRPPRDTHVEGELLTAQDAPALWQNLREQAKRINTAPPDHVIAGIDTNFFVTESPLTVGCQTIVGRCLFVSLPLLRILSRSEANAVLAHELAHLMGGDTASSARLGPKLIQYDHYCYLMRHGGVTIAIFHLIYLYRVIFEIALRRESRQREFSADRVAAKLVSAQAMATSLIKVVAYNNYRSQVEQQLFNHDTQHHDQLDIAKQVAAGLNPYALSASFVESMQTANVPHPFDSHPPLTERMQNVGVRIDSTSYGSVVTTTPDSTWVSDIQTADAVEQRLWTVYEQRFAAQHEASLAYRYLPSNDVERAVVHKHFPPVEFKLRKNRVIEINCDGIKLPEDGALLYWNRVVNLRYIDGMGGDVLEITHPEKGFLGRKTTRVKLPGIAKQRTQFKQVLARYWYRYQVAQNNAAAQTSGSST